MSEKHHEKEQEKEQPPVTPVTPGQVNAPPAVPVNRSATEQSVIDTLGTDPSKYKEGTRERELVEALPENIAKKREAEEKAGTKGSGKANA